VFVAFGIYAGLLLLNALLPSEPSKTDLAPSALRVLRQRQQQWEQQRQMQEQHQEQQWQAAGDVSVR
jgi:hypothetical protein